MEINPIKGFDGTVLEFAKQIWTINNYNLSPLGAKNILLFMRNVEFLPSLLYELIVKMFPFFLKGRVLLTFQGSKISNKRNWKRTADSFTALPIITISSLENLVSILFFQKKNKYTLEVSLTPSVEDAFRYLRVRLRVLMAIGPRSGLWFINRNLISYISESKYMARFFRELFITALEHWNFMSRGQLMKYMRTKDERTLRRNIWRDLLKDLSTSYVLLLEFVLLPFTFLPIENMKSARFSHFMNRTNWILIIFSPSSFNLVLSLFKLVKKAIYKAWLIFRLNWLRSLKYWSLHGFMSELFIASVLSFLLTRSLFVTLEWMLLCFVWHKIVTSDYFSKEIIWLVHETTGFAWWQPYDPLGGNVSTLAKVAEKVRLEDSGAYKEIISMLRGNKQIIGYLRRKNESLQKIKGIKPYTKIDGISINNKIKFNSNKKRKMNINYSNKPLL
jgi:hypothetical protein